MNKINVMFIDLDNNYDIIQLPVLYHRTKYGVTLCIIPRITFNLENKKLETNKKLFIISELTTGMCYNKSPYYSISTAKKQIAKILDKDCARIKKYTKLNPILN